jgi:hypothetical protein
LWDLWWTKWHWERFHPSTAVFLADSYCTNCPIPILSSCTSGYTKLDPRERALLTAVEFEVKERSNCVRFEVFTAVTMN